MNSTTILDALSSIHPEPVDIVVTLGSGLSEFTGTLSGSTSIRISDLLGTTVRAVEGHRAAVVFGSIGTKRVLTFSGRFHMYEGHSFDVSSLPAAASSRFNASLMIATNAAGGVNPLLSPGDFMLINDYLLLPVAVQEFGSAENRHEKEQRDRATAISADAMRMIGETARRLSMTLHTGTYAYVSGPSYETKAEIAMLRRSGVDAVGMSTVPELITATRFGIPWLGISCITNKAAGMHSHISHHDVLHTASLNGSKLASLLREFIMEYHNSGADRCSE